MEVVPKGSDFIEKKNQHRKRLRHTAIIYSPFLASCSRRADDSGAT